MLHTSCCLYLLTCSVLHLQELLAVVSVPIVLVTFMRLQLVAGMPADL